MFPASFLLFTMAPFSMNRFISFVWPRTLARCRGSLPCLSLAKMSASFRSRNLATLASPSSAAACSGVPFSNPSRAFTESTRLIHCLRSVSMSLWSESTSPLSTAWCRD